MPLWYWQKIAEYKIDVDAIENYVSALRQTEKEQNKKSESKESGKK
jgi:hypothetical protein